MKRRPKIRSRSIESTGGGEAPSQLPVVGEPVLAPTEVEVVCTEYRVIMRGRGVLGRISVESAGRVGSKSSEEKALLAPTQNRRFVL